MLRSGARCRNDTPRRAPAGGGWSNGKTRVCWSRSGCRTESASPAQVTLVEGVLPEIPVVAPPTPLIADRAYDSDKLRQSLLAKGWDLFCPHRRGLVRP